MERPWLGQVEPPQAANLPEYDENCYLCPGAFRSSGQQNPQYTSTFTFENDFAAVLPAPAAEIPAPLHPLMTVEPVHGTCDVLVFHPRHDLAIPRLDQEDIEKIIEEWIRIYLARGTEPGINYVQIFEVKTFLLHCSYLHLCKVQNKGAMMGCSNPHPHGQVWSMSVVPTIPAQELRSLKNYALTSSQPSAAPKGYGGL
jgi:UDPglucose--hexose-1-phosphate uridylyltransferase